MVILCLVPWCQCSLSLVFICSALPWLLFIPYCTPTTAPDDNVLISAAYWTLIVWQPYKTNHPTPQLAAARTSIDLTSPCVSLIHYPLLSHPDSGCSCFRPHPSLVHWHTICRWRFQATFMLSEVVNITFLCIITRHGSHSSSWHGTRCECGLFVISSMLLESKNIQQLGSEISIRVCFCSVSSSSPQHNFVKENTNKIEI